MNKFECKDCKRHITKVWNGKFKKGARSKEKVYVDHKGRLWNGRRCYACNVVYHREYQRGISRLKVSEKPKKEILLGPEVNLDPLTHRKCEECKKRLPKSRYFRHKECEDKIHASEGTGFYTAEDWGYGVGLGSNETLTFKISEMNLLGAT